MLIIAVRGIPGSGKTHLCTRMLPPYTPETAAGVLCLDTDDIVRDAWHQEYTKLKDGPYPVTPPRVFAAARAALKATLKQAGRNGVRVVVIAGILLGVPEADLKFFIKMSKEQLRDAYPRVIQRELDKHKSIDRAFLARLKPDDWANYLGLALGINAIDPARTTMPIYQGHYRQAIQYERKRGFLALTQEQIAAKVAAAVASQRQ